MRILVICEHGNNRSVTIAGQLKYWGHDVLTGGILTNTPKTLTMLCLWADRVILVDHPHVDLLTVQLPEDVLAKFQVWQVGPDIYPRPYNKKLLAKVKELMREHEEEYK